MNANAQRAASANAQDADLVASELSEIHFMSQEFKFCIDCHRCRADGATWECKGVLNLVTGEFINMSSVYARAQMSPSGFVYCGPEARFFTPANPPADSLRHNS